MFAFLKLIVVREPFITHKDNSIPITIDGIKKSLKSRIVKSVINLSDRAAGGNPSVIAIVGTSYFALASSFTIPLLMLRITNPTMGSRTLITTCVL